MLIITIAFAIRLIMVTVIIKNNTMHSITITRNTDNAKFANANRNIKIIVIMQFRNDNNIQLIIIRINIISVVLVHDSCV